MPFTTEQNEIFEKIQEENCNLLKVNSVAGSGKTTVLVELSKILSPKNGVYLAYNKAIATEAGKKFSKGVNCMTTHSLAYQNTIKPLKLSVGFFNYKVINERIPYEYKVVLIELLRQFSLSKYIKYDDFVRMKKRTLANVPEKVYNLTKEYFTKMTKGQIPITHDAYLKLYHLLLYSGKIKHQKFDMVMLDEAGDLNEVTLEIFKLLPAKKKIMVGDENQNIYTFNNTINGFEEMKNLGIQLNMTRSFRCSIEIAEKIETFCQTYIDPRMEFKGTKCTDMTIETTAYIYKNNSSLVGRIISLNKQNKKYNLTRPAKSIFSLILILLSLVPGGKIYSEEWKHIQEDVDDWNADPMLSLDHKTALSYVASIYNNEPMISSAMNIIRSNESGEIFAAFEDAKKHEKQKNHKITLCTAHSSKGLEFDDVYIGSDMNDAVFKIISERTRANFFPKDIEMMRLYYVACSRALKKIQNATYLYNTI